MKHRLRIPIRLKFMLTLLVLVTAVVGLITASTASLFQEDKKAYVNGLTSMVALGSADEARSKLIGYRERIALYADLISDVDLLPAQREMLSRRVFKDFPELVAVVLQRPGEPPQGVFNVSALKAAGISQEDLERFEAEHPLPVDSLEPGQPFVRNSTLSSRLPCFTLAFQHEVDDASEPLSVRAVLRTEPLQALTSRFSAYEQFLVGSDGAFLAHSVPRQVAQRSSAILPPGANDVHDEFSAGVSLEFERDGIPLIGGYASVDFAGVVAGAQIPESAAHLASKRLMDRLLMVAAALLVAALVLGIVWAHGITRPMEHLSNATRKIAKGQFDVDVTVESRDELGELAGSFNHMASELKHRESELGKAHAQLVQSEKMAAFGQLGAGFAHEVKNPLAGILACSQLAAEEVEPDTQVHEDLLLIEKETKRCKMIIENLLKFARQEKATMEPSAVNDIIEDSIAIVSHQLTLNRIHVETELSPELPQVQANANQLQQVFMNLMINAQQAMEEQKGTIRIRSAFDDQGRVELRFADTGPGIPEEIRGKLFEPFFTTKPTGKGTGLGLSVSYGIIQDHHGEITVESTVGEGTTFVITFPTLGDPSAQEDVEQATLVHA